MHDKSEIKSFLCKRTLQQRHRSYLERSLVSVRPHVNIKGGIVGEFLVAILAAEARSVFGLVERPLEMGEHVLLQRGVGGESAPARPHRAFERRLARVGQPVQVQALLGHAAVATQVALDLGGEEEKEEG